MGPGVGSHAKQGPILPSPLLESRGSVWPQQSRGHALRGSGVQEATPPAALSPQPLTPSLLPQEVVRLWHATCSAPPSELGQEAKVRVPPRVPPMGGVQSAPHSWCRGP